MNFSPASWSYDYGFEPSLIKETYADFATAAAANAQYTVEYLISKTPKTATDAADIADKKLGSNRFALQSGLEKLRETTPSNVTWHDIYCNENSMRLFVCNKTHWETVFCKVTD